MAGLTRLLTLVDIDEADDAGPDARSMSVTARHEAVLADGRHVVLLNNRGWNATQGFRWVGEPSEEDRRRFELDYPGIWASQTEEEMKQEPRVVVGPDEPFEGHSQADMEADHWNSLARNLRQHGVEVAAAELKTLRHDVELSDRVLARIGPYECRSPFARLVGRRAPAQVARPTALPRAPEDLGAPAAEALSPTPDAA